ncbi:peptidoglycan DD-metalloendopeptidase family protein [Leucobacter sp. cx-42]|uniref:peptidoglycan DD-metalloendopeptidase family protein n=1 Tax=unclassified Leucobacter TaxID=2621730 RepID=UPI00165DE3C5|nr:MULTISPECIES: peptidoglycan DD-metalloendopeptidase family protein [unclassified Leucobacter]MBC9953232.1 peptidoglycan DD-metalloendopeptidase family protein [Leucobacter sp. cx-42]
MAANGIEVASAYLSLIVKAPGIGKEINKAVGGVDTSAAGKRIGKQISDSVGASLKNQVAKKFAEATAAAFDKQTTAAKKLADAEHALVKARAQHGTASAKVTSAEEKLEKLRASGKASTGDLEKAEAALAKAQADAAGTSRSVVSAQNSVTEAKRNATEASKAYTSALEAEGSKSARALEWLPLASARLDEIGNKWKSAGAQISGVGDSITSKITTPVLIAGGSVAALVGALGFKRLVGIDTARGQFKGLGMDADAVMKQVDAGVTNTSLSMATGASLAVGILATGSVPLQGLEAQLKRVANVSAAYNVESEHAGYLLNNVLSKNKVTYGDLSQMVQNQIPIITQLADHYGVAAGEIEGMANRGEISIEDFNAVLDKNAGKAAESYAETWAGVTSNILSNLGKIGAKFMEPTFELMKTEAASFLDTLKSEEFSKFATDIGNRIASLVTTVAGKIKELIGWWNGLSEGQKKFIGVAAGVLLVLGPVLSIVGKIITGVGTLIQVTKLLLFPLKALPAAIGAIKLMQAGWNAVALGGAGVTKALTGATKGQTLAMKAGAVAQKVFNAALWKSPITWVVAGIAALVAGLVWFFTKTELGRKIWGEFTQFLGEAWDNIVKFTTEAVQNVVSFVKNHWGLLLSFIIGPLGLAIQWVVEHWGEITQFFTEAWENIKIAFTNAINFLIQLFLDWTPLGLIIKNWDAIASFFSDVWDEITLVFSKVIELITSFIMEWTPLGLIIKNWDSITAWFSEFWNKITTFFSDALAAVVQLFLDWTPIGQIIQNWDAITAWFGQFWEGVKSVFQTALDWVVQMFLEWTVFGQIIQNWDAIKQYFVDLWTSITEWVLQKITEIQTIIGVVGTFISQIWTNIWNGIKTFFAGIWNGIVTLVTWYIEGVKTGISNGINFVSMIWTNVWNGIKNTLANVWNGIKSILDALISFVKDGPVKAFERARDGIGNAWSAIQDLSKKPVKFVVETVFNGLIDAINKIPGVNLPKLSLPKGFARGGILPGMSRMSDGDDQLIMARRGEGMMVSEALRTSADRSAFLAANAAGRRGIGFASMLQGLARGGLVHPMPGAVVTEEYGGYPGHRGIDLALPQGTPIRAAASGTVDFSGWYGGGGWMAGLNHGRGLGTRYKHMMSPPIVAVGQKVKQRQVIGYEGTTGDSTGPHLHYEVLKNGDRINPRPYLDGAGDAGMLDIFEGLKGLLKGQFTKAFPGSEMWIDAAWGIGADGIDRAIKWGKSMLPWGGGIAPLLYDNGGFLDPGTHLVQNKTRRPEPILTGSQWDDIRASRDGGGLRSGDQLVLRVGEEEFDAYVEHKADSRIQRAGRRDAARMRTRQGLN